MTAKNTVALIALALGGFAIGCSEFVGIGLLPEIASEFWPTLAAMNPDAANADAAQFISLYAVGVVIGGPLLGAVAARSNPRPFLLTLLIAMSIGTALTAIIPAIAPLLGFRVLSAIPHAAFFGVAAIAGGRLMGRGHEGRGVGLVLGGLAFANVVGVPLATWLGHEFGWRVCYLIIALLFLAAFGGVFWGLQPYSLVHRVPLRRSFQVFTTRTLWSVLVMGAAGSAGLFAVIAYTVPLLVDGADVSQAALPWVLVILGIGMTLGNIAGGAIADIRLSLALWMAFLAAAAGFIVLLVWIDTPWGAISGIALLMFALSGISPFTQVSLMNAAGDNRSMGGTLNSSCMNLGNAAGATLGGLVIASGAGYSAVIWVGIILTLVGFVLALKTMRPSQRSTDLNWREALCEPV